mgnify:CR=1 FL=1
MLQTADFTQFDLALGVVATVLILEITRRILGPILPILAIFSILYAFLGPYLPGDFRHHLHHAFYVGNDEVERDEIGASGARSPVGAGSLGRRRAGGPRLAARDYDGQPQKTSL